MSVKIISIKTLPKKSQVVTIKKQTKKASPASSKDVIKTVVQPSKSKELISPPSQPSQYKKLVLPTIQPHQSKVLSPLNYPSKSKDLVLPTSQPFKSKALSPLKSSPTKSKDLEPPTSPSIQSKARSPLKSYPSRSKTFQPKEPELPTFHIIPSKGGRPLARKFSTKPRIISKTKLFKSRTSIDATVPESPLKKIPEKVLSESSGFVNPKEPEKKTSEKLESKIDSHIEPNKTVKVVLEKMPATASSTVLKIPVHMKKDKTPVITVAKSKSLVPAVTKERPMTTNVDEPTTSGPVSIKDMPIISDIDQPYNPVPMVIDNVPVITSIGESSKPIQVIFQQLPHQTGNLFKQRGGMQVVLESVPKNPNTSVESKSSMQVALHQAPQASTSVQSNVTKIIQKLPKISNITSLANVNIMEFFPTSETPATIMEPMEFNFDESLLLGNPVETVQNNPDAGTTVKHDSLNQKVDFKCPYCEYYARKTHFVYTHIRKKHEGMRVYYINA